MPSSHPVATGLYTITGVTILQWGQGQGQDREPEGPPHLASSCGIIGKCFCLSFPTSSCCSYSLFLFQGKEDRILLPKSPCLAKRTFLSFPSHSVLLALPATLGPGSEKPGDPQATSPFPLPMPPLYYQPKILLAPPRYSEISM